VKRRRVFFTATALRKRDWWQTNRFNGEVFTPIEAGLQLSK